MTALIILAAGSSSRLGQPKQKLVYQGKSLLQHAVDEGLLSACAEVIVVLGANETELRNEITSDEVKIVVNHNWQEGMSSSIKTGISFLLENRPDLSKAIIMLCDQPFVDVSILNRLIEEKQQSGKPIVACTYDNTLGTPVLFDRSFFPQLLSLSGQGGAKKLVYANKEQAAVVPFPMGNIDIDTPQDYEKLKAL